MGNNQNRREFLKTVGLTAAALAVPGCNGSMQQTAGKFSGRKPNVIFIMADDMGIGDTTVYNPQSKIPTPHMEKLAAQGVQSGSTSPYASIDVLAEGLGLGFGHNLNVFQMNVVIWGELFRTPVQPAPPLWSAWLTLILACAISLRILYNKVRAYEVVR